MENNIKIIEGNLLEINVNVIAHQVNCKGVMGAGLAKQIRSRYPDVYTSYKKACNAQTDLLGKVQLVATPDCRVANLFSQSNYGTGKCYTNYEALAMCLTKLRYRMETLGLKELGLPYGLGCGLAGGDWKIVYEIIRDVFTPSEITVYICKI